MLNFNEQDNIDEIPHLMPVKKKKAELQLSTPSEKGSIQNNSNNPLKQQTKSTPTQQLTKNMAKNFSQTQKESNPEKTKQMKDKIKERILILPKKNNQPMKSQSEWEKQRQRIKSQKLNSISAKNVAEQLYPISNEVLQLCISQIQQQIEKLKNEAQKKQSNLSSNPTNTQLKTELTSIKSEIDHCYKIKQLYYKKLNYRNKIRILEERILTLENQNNEIRKKVVNGIENVESYKHHMPCDPQKQVQQKLENCIQELEKQKKMKQTLLEEGVLEKFDKLYELAEKAREIATKKLREVEEGEKKVRQMKNEEVEQLSSDFNTPKKPASSFEVIEEKKGLNSHNLDQNDYNQTNILKVTDNDLNKSTYRQKPNNVVIPTREKEEKKGVQLSNNSMSMQEKIRKMRGNQVKLQLPT